MNAKDKDKNNALLMGFVLTQARRWLAGRKDDIPKADQTFIVQSRKAAQRCNPPGQALVLVAAMAAGATTLWNQDWVREEVYALAYGPPSRGRRGTPSRQATISKSAAIARS